MSKQNAEMLPVLFLGRKLERYNQWLITVQAPSLVQAGEQVANRINGRDPTLPAGTLEKTDNTVVTTEKLNEEQQAVARKVNEKNAGAGKPKINEEYGVGVYKNNNYRIWEWSVGYDQQNGEGYIPIGIQRNYSKDKAVVVEMHLDIGKMKSVAGWEVKQVWKTDKLFVIF